jgi:vacuolar-type H+-ATPase subunit H
MIKAKSITVADGVHEPLRIAGDESVAEAMRRILEAERDARAQVAGCHQRANAILEAARARAHVIARRADARISRLHGSYLRRIDERVAEMTRADPSVHAADVSTDEKALAEVVAQVAADMTS